jgi:hypothetical protein
MKRKKYYNAASLVLYEDVLIDIEGKKEIKVDNAFCGVFMLT